MDPRHDSICAIVLCHDSLSLVQRSVKSLLASDHDALRILVVDNGSENDPTRELTSLDERIRVIRNTENLGVAGGRNVGLRSAKEMGCDYALFFDDDALASPDMISRLLATSRSFDADITGPVITYTDDPGKIWRAGGLNWRRYYLSVYPEFVERISRVFGVYPVKSLDVSRGKDWFIEDAPREDEEVDFIIGCCQLVRLSVVEKVGLLDERFHPYGGEDIDFCERVRKSGGRVFLSARARASHDRPSSVSEPGFRTEINNAHMMLLAAKHLGPASYLMRYLPDLLLLQLPMKIALYGMNTDSARMRGLLRGVRRGLELSSSAIHERISRDSPSG